MLFSHSSEAYLTACTGHPSNVARTTNLVRNLRWAGDRRPIFVVTDRPDVFQRLPGVIPRPVPPECGRDYFCHLKLFPRRHCPATRIMWLDSDMLIPVGIDHLWALRAQPVYVNTCSGEVQKDTAGRRWFFWDVGHTTRELDIPHVFCLQNGWILWNDTPQEFTDYMRHVMADAERLRLRKYIDNVQLCDEPVLGVALAKFGLEPATVPAQYIVEDSDYLKFVFGQGAEFEVGRGTDDKPGRLTDRVVVSPAMAHFSGTTKYGYGTGYKVCRWYARVLTGAPWK